MNSQFSTRNLALIIFTLLGISQVGLAQNQTQQFARTGLNPITTSVPFLLIAPESRGGAMGDAGVASSPDANSMHWNCSKLAFIEKKSGVSVAYTPWLKTLVPDIALAYLSGFYKISSKGTIGTSLRYFSLGEIQFTNDQNVNLNKFTPNEFAYDIGYSHRLNKHFSGGLTARYIYSNLTGGFDPQGAGKAANAVAADLSGYYNTDIKLGSKKGVFAAGINISNLGNKVRYSDSGKKNFIPSNLKLGTSLKLDVDDYNSLTIMVDFNKLLVPTLPIYATDSTGKYILDSDGNKKIERGRNPDVSVPQGVFQSFYDAPGGFREELTEINISAGLEYWYDKQFALRAGFFYENPNKGNRQYFTLGAGLKYSIFNLDFSYLVSTMRNNPLDNTLRFTLSFAFDDIKDEKKED